MENSEDYFVVLLLIRCRLCGLCTLIIQYGFINLTRYIGVMMICKMCSVQ